MVLRAGLSAVLASVLLASLGSASASAANTWAGTWTSSFGRLTLGAGGSGSYEGFNPGTVTGKVTGNVNKGTWDQPGTPPKNGTFTFTLSGDGRSFTGDWAYGPPGGGCGSACGWNGTCIEGACLKNGATPVTPPKKCKAPTKGRTATSAAAGCTFEVAFSFQLDGFPDQPAETSLPDSLVGVELRTSATKLVDDDSTRKPKAQGLVVMTNTYLGRNIEPVDKTVTFTLDSGGYAFREFGLRVVVVRGVVTASDDANCPKGTSLSFGVAAKKGSSVKLQVDRIKGKCLTSRSLIWTTRRSFKSVKIGLPRQIL
jgi:hypothetical protein